MEPNPLRTTNVSFETLLQHPVLIENLVGKLQYSPSPIQEAVIPSILDGKDIYAGAKTGSGKTIAFLAPIIQRLFNDSAKKALILAPTRELALQIDEEAMLILEGQSKLVSIPLYGGVPIDPQILALRHHHPRILIATPGRMIDFIQEGCLPLNELEICVLDEADRMCDMGFAPQVTQILDVLPHRKQTLLFSATLPKQLNDIMSRFCPNPVRIQVDAADEASDTINHQVILCDRHEKVTQLIRILELPDVSCLVFTKTRKRADELHRTLTRKGVAVGILHAGYSMPERERTMKGFREQSIRHIIATDVVSRGIDVDHLTHVVHYDLPDALEEYIHRSGRSGRAGRTGTTIALVEKGNRNQLAQLEELKKKVNPEMIGQLNRNASAPASSPKAPKTHDRNNTPSKKDHREQRHSRPTRHSPRDQHRTRSKPHRENVRPKTTMIMKAKAWIKSLFRN